MHYPWWYVPALTSPMLIALVAVLHIYVAMYAVGGGILLAAETARARRDGDGVMLEYLKRHAWFFILLTVVYGAMTGVGIWWTIGLASPLATEALIHIFVFGWAIEWCAFVIEIVSAFLFYYFWDRVTAGTHVTLGRIYAWSAWLSLVLITGITAFQLNPGRWPETGGFWVAFLNPQFIPQTICRTGGSILLASLYFYLHASFRLADDAVRERLVRSVSRWTLPGVLMIAVGGLGWAVLLPPSGKAVIEGTGAMNVFAGLCLAVTLLVTGLLTYGPGRRPSDVNRPLAIGLFCLALMAIGASEFLREATRKPYVVYDLVYGHGVYKDEVTELQDQGILTRGVWPAQYARSRYPALAGADGRVEAWRASALSTDQRLDLGRTLFMYHCNDCHAVRGYSGVHGLIRGWERSDLERVVHHPDRIHYFMPPWSGTEDEAVLLIEYLESVTPPHPIEDRPTAAPR